MWWLFGSESGMKPGELVEVVCPYCQQYTQCLESINTYSFNVWFIPIISRQKLAGYVCQECGNSFEESEEQGDHKATYANEEVRKIVEHAKKLVATINAAKNKAAASMEIKAKARYLKQAKEGLRELKVIANKHTFLNLTSLMEFEEELSEIETKLLDSVASKEDVKSGNENNDIFDGYVFSTSMMLSTPLSALEHHNEIHSGPESKLPEYGGMEHGAWIPKTKSWADLAGSEVIKERLKKIENNLPSNPIWSDVGEIPGDGGTYLSFLKDFRTIIESKKDPEQKQIEVLALSRKNKDYNEYIEEHKEHDNNWLDHYLGYDEILGLKGIGDKIAKALYEAGYRSPVQLRGASDGDLKSVKGIGPAKLKIIRKIINS